LPPDNPAAKWAALRDAVCEAKAHGAEFRVIGADIEISGELPAELRARLPVELLWSYLGAEKTDLQAQQFARLLGITPVLVTTAAALAGVFEKLAGAEYIGIDIETGEPGSRPPPVMLNKDGSVAAIQPKPDDAGLDPRRSAIMTVQLCADGEQVFVITGDALPQLLASRWLDKQRLVAHNALFELAFLQHHAGLAPAWPVECTMQASGLVYGPPRSLADACGKAGIPAPPKTLQTTCWNALRLSAGQIAYAGADAALSCVLWADLQDKLAETNRQQVYELQRDAISAVAAMQLRGLGYDRQAHAEQIAAWQSEHAAAQAEYRALTDSAPPSTPNDVRRWLEQNLPAARLAAWPRSDTAGLLSIEGKHLKRLTSVSTVKPVLAMLAMEKLLSSFGASLQEHVNRQTGRLHASYNIAGAKSGRFSCSRPNLQQLPANRAPQLRNCVVAPPGYLLVSADWSQIELRAAAWLFKDPVLTAVYKRRRCRPGA
jgi:DNA polymerase-1